MQPDLYDLNGRVAIVTGAARGIGFASASRLAAAGARVMLADLDEAAVKQAAGAIDGDVATFAADLTQKDVPDRLIAATFKQMGGIDIVFNNAGYNWDAPLREMSDEQFAAMLDIHVVVPFRILRAAAPHLLDEHGAEQSHHKKVINSSSVSGTMGNPNQANYNAGKAAIIGLTKGLAKEWGRYRINVNAIAPGFIETRLTSTPDSAGHIAVAGHDVALGIPKEHRRKGFDLTVLERPGTADEVARVVAFLASSASDYMTGQVLSVTGGLMLGLES